VKIDLRRRFRHIRLRLVRFQQASLPFSESYVKPQAGRKQSITNTRRVFTARLMIHDRLYPFKRLIVELR